MVAGVYAITNTTTGEQYVGSSQDIARHWTQHRQYACNMRLRAARLRDGDAAMRLDILEEVADATQLATREQYHLDRLKPAYNVNLRALRPPPASDYCPEGYLTVGQAGEYSGLSSSKMADLIARGYLPVKQTMLHWSIKLIKREDIDSLLDQYA